MVYEIYYKIYYIGKCKKNVLKSLASLKYYTLVAENPYPRGRGWIATLFCFLTVYIFDDYIL